MGTANPCVVVEDFDFHRIHRSRVFPQEESSCVASVPEYYSFHRGSNPPEGERKQGAINEDLRGNSEDPQGKSDEPGRKSTRRSGNREHGDRAKRPLVARVITEWFGKGGLRLASTGQVRQWHDVAIRFRTESSKLGKKGRFLAREIALHFCGKTKKASGPRASSLTPKESGF